MRLRPSNWKGLFTTPTVSAPPSRAIRAITGADPVPVPPPIPAVTNTISASARTSRSASSSSSAALRPISGLPPVPRPRVSICPICMRIGAVLFCSACASVFTETKSTLRKPAAIMWLTALPPQPPAPITLIRAPGSAFSINSIITEFPPPHPPNYFRPARKIMPHACDLKKIPHPVADPRTKPAPTLVPRRAVAVSAARSGVQQQTGRRRVHRLHQFFRQPFQIDRQAAPHRKVEDALGQLLRSLEQRGAADQHDAGAEAVEHARANQLALRHREDLFHARLDNLAQQMARDEARIAAADAGHLHHLVAPDHQIGRDAVTQLDPL